MSNAITRIWTNEFEKLADAEQVINEVLLQLDETIIINVSVKYTANKKNPYIATIIYRVNPSNEHIISGLQTRGITATWVNI